MALMRGYAMARNRRSSFFVVFFPQETRFDISYKLSKKNITNLSSVVKI